MPNFPVSSISFNADIPIYLDSDHGRTPTRTEEPPYEICLKCSASSRDQPIHCISKPLPPPPYEIAAPPTPCPGRSAIPVLNLQTPAGDWSNPVRPHRPAPAFRPDDDGRRVRFRHNAFSPISPQTLDQRLDNHVGNHIGLGIPDAPFKPDASPITPGTAEKAEKTKELRSPAGEGSSGPVFGTLGLVQRVEERLWKYSASRNVVKRWLVEIISWCISALCTAIIIIVLFIYQRRPIPKWPLGLTLNAFISVLAKIASAALLLPVSEALGQLKWNWFQGKQNKSTESKKMWDFELFDNASRGPWGSFLLLLRTKGRSLAALGCAVTIFALAMDPFFQQVVAFPETWRIQPRNGSLARAVTYSRYVAEDYFLGSNFEVLEPDQMMSSTAFRYFFEQGTKTAASRNGNWSSSVESRPEIPLTCPANKCTWTEYETLAVCNRCKEIPDRLEFRCRTSTLDWIPDPVVLEDLSYWDYPNGTACGWYLIADDPVLMTGYVIDLSTNHTGNVLVQRSQPLYDVFTRAPLPGYAAKMNDTRNPIAHFVTVSGVDAVQVRQNATPIANECMISWCIKSLQSTIQLANYTENVTAVKFNNSLGPNPWTVETVFEDGLSRGQSITYTENLTIVGDTGYEYFIGNETHSSVVMIFDDIFPSTYTVTNTTDMAQAVLRCAQWRTGSSSIRPVSEYNPFLYSNITQQLDSLATDFTNIIRSRTKSIEMTEGQALDLVSEVEVRWVWLSLPLGLLFLTFIFLVGTIIRSSMAQGVGVWKTSAIATLLYGFPDHVRNKVTSTKVHGTPRANAKDTRVKWLPGTGWRLSGASAAFSPSSLRSRHSPRPTD